MRIKRYTLTLLSFFVFFSCVSVLDLWAQNLEEENGKVLARMDKEPLKGKIVLNKAIALDEHLALFRKPEKDKDNVIRINLEPGLLLDLIDMAERGDIEDKKKPDALDKIQKRSRNEITASNVVPVAIINLDALLLSEAQVDENIKAKSEGKKADGSRYETVELIAAGLIQEEIFQGDVQFQLSRGLLYSNNKNEIRAVSIDFLDGKGWQEYSFKDELINHRFESVGEVGIYIKLETERGTYITGNTLKINMLNRFKADVTEKVIEEGNKNGRLTETVLGAEFAIYNGCDQVFNKPIIIAEGFDKGQDNNIDDMVARFAPYLNTFRNNGYDFVFVNYVDGQAAIQNNAQVLKRVINEVKSRIPASDSIIVVGQSMSGLIARWALREMENAGQSHKVKLLVAFDSGQQGSYIPPGLVALRRSLPILAGWATPIVKLLSSEVRSIDSPGSRQLLMYYNLSTNSYSRHSDFNTLRQNLNNMGNGGYPALSRNIAIINGSLSGTRQKSEDSPTNDIVPGDKLLDFTFWTFLTGGGRIEVRSNKPGQNSQLLAASTSTFLNPVGISSFAANLPYSYDRLPGGFVNTQAMKLPLGFFNPVRPKFTHMPVFSSIDYRGALNSDNAHTFSVAGTITNINNQVINQSLTPFKAIYGNGLDNTQHTFPRDIQDAWNTLALRELGITETPSGCQLAFPPPVSRARQVSRGQWANSALPSSVCKYSPRADYIILAVTGNDYWYTQHIRITGPSNYDINLIPDASGRAVWNYAYLPNGSYNIHCVRLLSSGAGAATTRTIQLSSGCRVGSGCPNDDENGAVFCFLNDTNESCFSIKQNGVWIAALGDGTFVSRERLIANGVSTTDANCFAATDPQGNTPASNCTGLGGITYARWEGIGAGTSINDLVNVTNGFQNAPTFTQSLNIFEAPVDIADNYGVRMRGYICPPTSGQYTFWISGDDNSHLWLSTDENPDNSVLTALIDSWTPSREWSWYETQRSFPVTLQAGQKYYIEAQMKESTGGDNLAVGWQLPNGVLERPIPGNRLAPYSTDTNPPNCDFNISAFNSNSTPTTGQSLQLTFTCSGANCSGVNYSWSGNGVTGNSSPLTISAPPSAGTYTYIVAANRAGCSQKTATTSIQVGSTPSSNCINLSDQCSGNSSEIRTYTINVSTGSSLPFKLTYKAHEGPSTGRMRINGGSWQTFSLAQTGVGQYIEATIGNYSLNTGNNTIEFASGGGYICFRQLCAGTTSNPGNCDFNVSAGNSNGNPSAGQSMQLSFTCSGTNCGGVTYLWSGNGVSGSTSPLNISAPSSTGTYTYTVTANQVGCPQKTATTSIQVGNTPLPNCINLGDQCSGNSSEIRTYTINMSSGGSIPFKLTYKAHEGPSTGRMRINAGSWQTFSLSQTAVGQYVESTIGNYSLNAGNNTIEFASGGGYICFRQLCAGNSGARTSSEENRGIDQIEELGNDQIIASPNPSDGKFDLRFYVKPGKIAVLTIVNQVGAELKSKRLYGHGWHLEHIELNQTDSGIVLIQVKTNERMLTKKVVLVK
jgi:hypothetical protein